MVLLDTGLYMLAQSLLNKGNYHLYVYEILGKAFFPYNCHMAELGAAIVLYLCFFHIGNTGLQDRPLKPICTWDMHQHQVFKYIYAYPATTDEHVKRNYNHTFGWKDIHSPLIVKTMTFYFLSSAMFR